MTEITWHLDLLNFSPHCLTHAAILLISCWDKIQSLIVRIHLQIFVSSAKMPINVPGEITSGRSLLNRINSNGPRMEPYGTPDSTGSQSE